MTQRQWSFRVVGVKALDPGNRKRRNLEQICAERGLDRLQMQSVEGITVLILRAPDNPYDSNACEIHMPALGVDGILGYAPRAVAADLAPAIDAGIRILARITGIFINDAAPDNYGIAVEVDEIVRVNA